MINLQVENLDEALAQLKREGVDVDPKVESYDYGKFGWIMGPEGNRVELWEPKESRINRSSVAPSSSEN
jgi:predicted enzyme related to lactoylglutathione lyase